VDFRKIRDKNEPKIADTIDGNENHAIYEIDRYKVDRYVWLLGNIMDL